MLDEKGGVLIIGGGLTGLSAALFLAWHGVPHMLVERQGDVSLDQRLVALNPRTMELLRSAGLEAALRQAAVRPDVLRSLSCDWSGADPKPAASEAPNAEGVEPRLDPISPCPWLVSRQDTLAALLAEHAEALGSDLRFGTRLVSFEQAAAGVTAVLEDPAAGRQEVLRAQYLVEAEASWRHQGPAPQHFSSGVVSGKATARVAGPFRQGRTFFAGRAALILGIPAVFALNLDLQEAHNLAWKLAYVMKGLAGPALLETYEAERRPAAEFAGQDPAGRCGSEPGGPRPYGSRPQGSSETLGV